MKAGRNTVRAIVFILGPLVLLSYVWGFSRLEEPSLVWGGVPLSLQPIYTACMFAAALGFLVGFFCWSFLWSPAAVESIVESISWPRQAPQLGGHRWLMVALLLILIPSMLWLELTALHLRVGALWSALLVIVDLLMVAGGSLMLLALSWRAYRERAASGALPVLIGMVAFNVQTVLLDAIVWILLFPW